MSAESEPQEPVLEEKKESSPSAASGVDGVLATLSELNPVPVVGEMVEELGKLQKGNNRPTFVRKFAADVRLQLDEWRGQYYQLKKDILNKAKETKAAPSKFVAETAVLQSAFLVKMCHHQPDVLIASAVLGTAIPTAMVSRRFGFFSGLMGGAVAYGFIQIINSQHGHPNSWGSFSPAKSVDAVKDIFKTK